MKFIKFDDICKLQISPQICYQWVDSMIIDKNQTLLPAKISMHPKEDIFCNVMPCIIYEEWAGVKIVNRYPGRIPSLDSKLWLLDNKSGVFVAIMDANWITTMRTGAVAAHSIIHFAKKNYTNISMIGLGNTCRATLLVLASVEKNKKLNVKLLRYKRQEEDFMKRFSKFDNISFTCTDSKEELIRGADVVVSCATYLGEDFCDASFFDDGVLVVPVHTRGFTNCDLVFDKVFADDYEHVKHFKYFEKYKYFAEVSDVITGKAKGRETERERILAYNIGLAIHDVFFASKIYEMLKESDSIMDIEMHGPTDKFWI